MIAGNGSPSLYNARGPQSRRERITAEDVTTIVDHLDEWIEKHPALCIAAALTMGVTFGWLIKRR
jgi:ElaB/YqjD/DUF883 family membrane-anchored ribosome-binding protein